MKEKTRDKLRELMYGISSLPDIKTSGNIIYQIWMAYQAALIEDEEDFFILVIEGLVKSHDRLEEAIIERVMTIPGPCRLKFPDEEKG